MMICHWNTTRNGYEWCDRDNIPTFCLQEMFKPRITRLVAHPITTAFIIDWET